MSELVHAVERNLRITARVSELNDAWAFVMEHVEEVSEPRIEISPVWFSDDGFRTAHYDVTISGEVV